MVAYTAQMSSYEILIDYFKKRFGLTYFEKNEKKFILAASIFSGIITSLCTNFFDVMIVAKQVDRKISFLEEWKKMLTKGIGAKTILSVG
eukprot:CAMPEP_0170562012 /NCGR_PEP_ID=MMETSP0211-20121228/58230_1 /TAXON_ID=311385 /ORGANISM="Pseudokeronopsis sp., Strain OXSARD2" /LENGTH=89 /DNA_ID=CAMNT_0010878313 /DNA_START=498 /DNA_END=764 /DNA_ORIENTATION=+